MWTKPIDTRRVLLAHRTTKKYASSPFAFSCESFTSTSPPVLPSGLGVQLTLTTTLMVLRLMNRAVLAMEMLPRGGGPFRRDFANANPLMVILRVRQRNRTARALLPFFPRDTIMFKIYLSHT